MPYPSNEGYPCKIFMIELAQITIDLLGWFLTPFSILVVVSWVVSLFRS